MVCVTRIIDEGGCHSLFGFEKSQVLELRTLDNIAHKKMFFVPFNSVGKLCSRSRSTVMVTALFQSGSEINCTAYSFDLIDVRVCLH